MPRLNDAELEEHAASAKAILNDPVVDEALKAMRYQYMDKLIAADVGSEQVTMYHASLKLIDDFKAQLQTVITEQKMRQRHRSRENG